MPRAPKHLVPSVALALAAVLGGVAHPAQAHAHRAASTVFGSSLRDAPGGGHCATACTLVALTHPGDPTALGSPVSGVITRFRIRASTPGRAALRLVAIVQAGPDGAAARPAGRAGPTVRVAGTGAVEEFAAALRVHRGDHLALDTAAVGAVHETVGRSTYVFSPPLGSRLGLRASDGTTGELLVQATVERDVDRDGLGDATQDRCVRRRR